ncbi:hypothetical protein DFH11DRAFT_1831569 [Phellopilus nigrolimitatus]|nr:hypothetical protein DFH11DRAFT_1831569 [Phellopilus nigrolimitatus]
MFLAMCPLRTQFNPTSALLVPGWMRTGSVRSAWAPQFHGATCVALISALLLHSFRVSSFRVLATSGFIYYFAMFFPSQCHGHHRISRVIYAKMTTQDVQMTHLYSEARPQKQDSLIHKAIFNFGVLRLRGLQQSRTVSQIACNKVHSPVLWNARSPVVWEAFVPIVAEAHVVYYFLVQQEPGYTVENICTQWSLSLPLLNSDGHFIYITRDLERFPISFILHFVRQSIRSAARIPFTSREPGRLLPLTISVIRDAARTAAKILGHWRSESASLDS